MEAIAALFFCPAKLPIDQRQQFLSVTRGRGAGGQHAAAAGDMRRRSRYAMRNAAVGQRGMDGLRDGDRSAVRGFRQDQQKFIASETSHQIGRSVRDVGQEVANTLQALITHDMPVGAIEGFEMVDIDHDQRQRMSAAVGSLAFAGQGFFEAALIGESGESIDETLIREQTIDVLKFFVAFPYFAFERLGGLNKFSRGLSVASSFEQQAGESDGQE